MSVLARCSPLRYLDLSATARVFALMYLASADASIACWDAKYTYNFWRPFPAIVNGRLDGNHETAATRSGSCCSPHRRTPSIRRATCNSSAMGTVLESCWATIRASELELTFFGVTRQWVSFAEGIDEVIDARLFSGFTTAPRTRWAPDLGRQVAHFVMTHALRPPTGSWKP